jgi:hypothetical protein
MKKKASWMYKAECNPFLQNSFTESCMAWIEACMSDEFWKLKRG